MTSTFSILIKFEEQKTSQQQIDEDVIQQGQQERQQVRQTFKKKSPDDIKEEGSAISIDYLNKGYVIIEPLTGSSGNKYVEGSFRCIEMNFGTLEISALVNSSDEEYEPVSQLDDRQTTELKVSEGDEENKKMFKIIRVYKTGKDWQEVYQGFYKIREICVTKPTASQGQREQQQVQQTTPQVQQTTPQVQQTTPQQQIDKDALQQGQQEQQQVQEQVQQTNQEGVQDLKKNELQNLPL